MARCDCHCSGTCCGDPAGSTPDALLSVEYLDPIPFNYPPDWIGPIGDYDETNVHGVVYSADVLFPDHCTYRAGTVTANSHLLRVVKATNVPGTLQLQLHGAFGAVATAQYQLGPGETFPTCCQFNAPAEFLSGSARAKVQWLRCPTCGTCPTKSTQFTIDAGQTIRVGPDCSPFSSPCGCDDLRGVHILSYRYDCVWTTTISGPDEKWVIEYWPGGGTGIWSSAQWVLRGQANVDAPYGIGYIIIRFDPTKPQHQGAVYIASPAAFNCVTGGTFTFHSARSTTLGRICKDWPATITAV